MSIETLLRSAKVEFAFVDSETGYCSGCDEKLALATVISSNLQALAENSVTTEEFSTLLPLKPFKVTLGGPDRRHHCAQSTEGYNEHSTFEIYWGHESYSYYTSAAQMLLVTRKTPSKGALPNEIGLYSYKPKDSEEYGQHVSVHANTNSNNSSSMRIYTKGARAGTCEIEGHNIRLAEKELGELLPWIDFSKLHALDSTKYQEEVVAKLRSIIFCNELPAN